MDRARELSSAGAGLMGFVWLGVIGVAAFALLWRLGIARALWSLVGAGLMLGATGYALQGRPLLPGHPVKADATPIDVDQGLIELRDRMFGRFTRDGAFLVASDALIRSGDTHAAASWILAGIKGTPDSALLWTGLGDTLALHDGGNVSPPALFAFRRAMQLAPQHPGPPFFLGLAYVRAGEFAAARPAWRRALALCPPQSGYCDQIAIRLALLDRYVATMPATGPLEQP